MDECNLLLPVLQQFRESCAGFDGLWIQRRRRFDTHEMIRALLHLVGGGQQSYGRVLDQLELQSPPALSSLCEARARFPSHVIGEVREDLLDVWDEQAPGSLWHGYRPHAIDGTKVSLPRALFQYGFRAPAAGHCPQGLVSLLVRLDDRMVRDLRLSQMQNERMEAHEHLAHLSPADLVVYDRGYLSFGLLTAHMQLGIEAVFRVRSTQTFKPIERFWKSSKVETVVTINPTSVTYRQTRKQFPEYDLIPIELRLIKYHIGDKTYVLATTILDPSISRDDFVDLYSQRWEAEETFKAYKETLELETFHSKSTGGIRQEIEAMGLFWNLTRKLALLAEPHIKKALYLSKNYALPS